MIRASLNEARISSHLAHLTRLSQTDLNSYWRVRVLSETSSTQDELKNELVSNGQCVVSEFQSAGRGRLDRSFQSPPGVALLFSFYIKPVRGDSQGWIPLIAGMSVAQSLNELTAETSYSNKWPNDVITDYGKVCGILCERYGDGIIVGIGLNVTTQIDELPVASATSIFISSGIEIDRNELLPTILHNFQELFQRWESGHDLQPRYRALSSTIGHEVQVSLPNGLSIESRAIKIGTNGELILESGDVVSVGDITHLRVNE